MSQKTHYIVAAEGALTVFTDGASLPSPRRGGIGVRFVYSDGKGDDVAWNLEEPGVAGATNNQMELLAVITALRTIQDRRFRTDLLEQATRIDLYTDSRRGQPRQRDVRVAAHSLDRSGSPVANADLWRDLVRELIRLKKTKLIEIKWGKGHSADNPHNKVVDKLAKASAKGLVRRPLVVDQIRAP